MNYRETEEREQNKQVRWIWLSQTAAMSGVWILHPGLQQVLCGGGREAAGHRASRCLGALILSHALSRFLHL